MSSLVISFMFSKQTILGHPACTFYLQDLYQLDTRFHTPTLHPEKSLGVMKPLGGTFIRLLGRRPITWKFWRPFFGFKPLDLPSILYLS